MSIKPNEKYIHPITLLEEENITKNVIYPTTLQINKKNKNLIYSQEKPDQQINLMLPSLLINFEQYLKYYNFESINDILNMLDSNIIYHKKIRILNGWIRINFNDLKKNRPFNILINKCLVSNEYEDNKINGYFNQGLMSGINNFNNSEDDKIVQVECETLTSILDRLEVKKIDFFSLDVEGYEKSVLEGLDFKKYRPTYILIEIFENNRQLVFNYMIENNYIFLENITNYNRFDNPGWSGDHNDYLFKAL